MVNGMLGAKSAVEHLMHNKVDTAKCDELIYHCNMLVEITLSIGIERHESCQLTWAWFE